MTAAAANAMEVGFFKDILVLEREDGTLESNG